MRDSWMWNDIDGGCVVAATYVLAVHDPTVAVIAVDKTLAVDLVWVSAAAQTGIDVSVAVTVAIGTFE